jgi:hypothetical protein
MQEIKTPKKTLSRYFNVLSAFQDILAKFKADNISFINNLLNRFNLSFKYPIQDGRFYHYVSEAWLLSIFHELKSLYAKDFEEATLFDNFTKNYRQILEDIQYLNIDVNFFVNSLEALLGINKFQDSVVKMGQFKLCHVYLKNINRARVEKLDCNLADEITEQQFEKILFQIILTGLGYTLGELDSKEDDKVTRLIISTLVKLDNNNEFELDFEKLIEEMERDLKRDMEQKEIDNLNLAKSFANFGKYCFDDIFNNIVVFNNNMSDISASFIYNVSVEGLKKLSKYIRDHIKFISRQGYLLNKPIEYLRNKRLESSDCAFNNVLAQKMKDMDILRKLAELQSFASLSNAGLLYNNICDFTLYKNTKDFLTYTTTNSYNIVINVSALTRSTISEYINLITSNLTEKYLNVKEFIFNGENPLFKITTDSEKYLHLEIRKNMKLLKMEKLCEIFNHIMEQFKAFSVISCAKQSAGCLVGRFKSMLGQGVCEDKAE